MLLQILFEAEVVFDLIEFVGFAAAYLLGFLGDCGVLEFSSSVEGAFAVERLGFLVVWVEARMRLDPCGEFIVVLHCVLKFLLQVCNLLLIDLHEFGLSHSFFVE